MSSSSATECDFSAQFHSDKKPESLSKFRSTGLTVAAVFGATSVSLMAVCLPFVRPAFRKICLPFVPATDTQIANVLKALSGCRGTLIDCGSGDGRIVFATASAGFTSTGVELNPVLVLYSKLKSWTTGTERNRVRFLKQDIFATDFTQYDNVVVFGVDSLMPELEKRFTSLPHEHRFNVVACRFPLPNIIPVSTVGQGIDTVWLYTFPVKNK